MLLQFKIQIRNTSKPPVWRKVLVPTTFTFEHFHLVIQAAFGWGNYHLYQFSPSGYGSSPEIGVPDGSDWSGEIVNSKKIKLSDIFTTKGQKFIYIYDFGDDWIHTITLEDIKEVEPSKKAELLAGKGACPPEDCGGHWGYVRMLEILQDPNDEEYESMKAWLGLEEGEVWNTKYFDEESAKKAVASV